MAREGKQTIVCCDRGKGNTMTCIWCWCCIELWEAMRYKTLKGRTHKKGQSWVSTLTSEWSTDAQKPWFTAFPLKRWFCCVVVSTVNLEKHLRVSDRKLMEESAESKRACSSSSTSLCVVSGSDEHDCGASKKIKALHLDQSFTVHSKCSRHGQTSCKKQKTTWDLIHERPCPSSEAD